MKKYVISKSGYQKTLVDFLGRSQITVSRWINRPNDKNHQVVMKIIEEMEDAQIAVLEKWQKKLSFTGIINHPIEK